jgi:hypothetical protein
MKEEDGILFNIHGTRHHQNTIVGYYITYSSILSEFIEPWFMSVHVSNKASKTIDTPGNLEGNTTHKMRCAVSPEIALMGGYNTQVFIA